MLSELPPPPPIKRPKLNSADDMETKTAAEIDEEPADESEFESEPDQPETMRIKAATFLLKLREGH